jgi:hypothetical protein
MKYFLLTLVIFASIDSGTAHARDYVGHGKTLEACAIDLAAQELTHFNITPEYIVSAEANPGISQELSNSMGDDAYDSRKREGWGSAKLKIYGIDHKYSRSGFMTVELGILDYYQIFDLEYKKALEIKVRDKSDHFECTNPGDQEEDLGVKSTPRVGHTQDGKVHLMLTVSWIDLFGTEPQIINYPLD